jgi:hypothetical protein
MTGTRVVAGAVAEGYDGVVLDVSGPVAHTITGDELSTLVAAAEALAANPGAHIGLIKDA